MGRPDYIFGQFREIARFRDAKHGGGICCAFARQLVPVFCVVSVGFLSAQYPAEDPLPSLLEESDVPHHQDQP